MRVRSRWLAALAAVVLAAAGCASSRAVLETTPFAAEAEVALGEMIWDRRGYFYRDILVGEGAVAESGRTVAISYVARLANGDEVDRVEPNAPAEFRVGEGRVIPALDMAIRGMRGGGVRQLVVPPALGYGARGVGPIPPNAVLVLMVRLH